MSDSTNSEPSKEVNTPAGMQTHGGVNGREAPEAVEAERLAALDRMAKGLLQPEPSALGVTGHQTVIAVVNSPLSAEFVRTHSTVRLSMMMVTPKKGTLGAHTYAVMPEALPYLARAMIEPFSATLFPVVIATRPLSYKLVMVKTPSGGKGWESYALSKKLALDEAVDQWRAIRMIGGGYQACKPDPAWPLPEEKELFPDYSLGEWIHKSLGVTDLIVHDDTHSMFKEINAPRR